MEGTEGVGWEHEGANIYLSARMDVLNDSLRLSHFQETYRMAAQDAAQNRMLGIILVKYLA